MQLLQFSVIKASVCVCVCVCVGGGGGGGVAPPVFATELPPSTPLISVYMHPHVFFNART